MKRSKNETSNAELSGNFTKRSIIKKSFNFFISSFFFFILQSIIAPTHPLIHAFLLRKKELDGVKNIIVESEEYAEKLEKHLSQLGEILPDKYQKTTIVKTHNDVLRIENYNLIGIYTTKVILDPPQAQKHEIPYIVEKGKKTSEKELLEWLSKNNFIANNSRQENTYFRQGDTIIISTLEGILQVSFLGNIIEDIYLNSVAREKYILLGK